MKAIPSGLHSILGVIRVIGVHTKLVKIWPLDNVCIPIEVIILNTYLNTSTPKNT